jgi:hypothetical protein
MEYEPELRRAIPQGATETDVLRRALVGHPASVPSQQVRERVPVACEVLARLREVAGGSVDDSRERRAVGWVVRQPEVCDRVPDFRTREKVETGSRPKRNATRS